MAKIQSQNKTVKIHSFFLWAIISVFTNRNGEILASGFFVCNINTCKAKKLVALQTLDVFKDLLWNMMDEGEEKNSSCHGKPDREKFSVYPETQDLER